MFTLWFHVKNLARYNLERHSQDRHYLERHNLDCLIPCRICNNVTTSSERPRPNLHQDLCAWALLRPQYSPQTHCCCLSQVSVAIMMAVAYRNNGLRLKTSKLLTADEHIPLNGLLNVTCDLTSYDVLVRYPQQTIPCRRTRSGGVTQRSSYANVQHDHILDCLLKGLSPVRRETLSYLLTVVYSKNSERKNSDVLYWIRASH
jgi:hypothetical protein